MRSKRFEALDARPVKKDGFVTEWPVEKAAFRWQVPLSI